MPMEDKLANIGTSATPTVLEALESATSQLDDLAGEIQTLHRLAMLGVLSAGIAHEINNILTPVIAYTHAALSGDADERMASKALRKALNGAEQVAAIVNGTLCASQTSDKMQSANIRETFEHALNALGRDLRRDGIKIDNDLPGEMDAAIEPVAMQQIFINLMLNASNAMSGSPGRIRVSAKQANDEIRIIVEDTGPGIPQHLRPRLFEPFVTGRVTQQRGRTTGTGLGLAVCRILAETSGGSINILSTGDDGTAFELTLHNRSKARSRQNAA